ncbi:hypothetical protein [Phenylobacterium sp.]|jgi:hypothetical protein|uniref:hypothetical protein n=1 Tax=Phenylobacterium sp. TaxID=1871053 RepID=UPI0035AF2F20
MDKPEPAYELDIAPDSEALGGGRWRYRKRWTRGLRRFLPALWHATDDDGVKRLRRQQQS